MSKIEVDYLSINYSSEIIKKIDKRFQNRKFKIFESKYLEINSKKAFKKFQSQLIKFLNN